MSGGGEAAPASSPRKAPGTYLRETPARLTRLSPPSVGKADMFTFIYYVVAFLTLASPVTINVMTFDDVTFPDMNLADNFEFFQRYVEWAPIGGGDTTGSECWSCVGESPMRVLIMG